MRFFGKEKQTLKRKNCIFIQLIFSLLLLISSCSSGQSKQARLISVRGIGTSEIENDTASIILSVITSAEDTNEAAKQNAKIMTNVTNAIADLGIKNENISTRNYSIKQESSYSAGKTVYGDYKVSNEIKITLNDISLTSAVIDAAVKAGANRLLSLTFYSSNTEIALKSARKQAIQNAKETAILLCEAGGAKLGQILKIEEVSDSVPPKLYTTRAVNDTVLNEEETPVMSGRTSVSIAVNVIYELK